MKTLKQLFILLFISSAFVACSKDDDPKPSSGGTTIPVNPDKSMKGTWVGKYGYGTDAPDTYYCFHIKDDGTLEEWNSLNTQSGVGTWTLTGTQFTASTHFLPPYTSIFLLNSTLDTTIMKISGTWGYSPSTINGGKFYLIKQ